MTTQDKVAQALRTGLEMTQELLAMKHGALGDDYMRTRSYWAAEREISAALAEHEAAQPAPAQHAGSCPACCSDCNERDELIKAEREIERLRGVQLAQQPVSEQAEREAFENFASDDGDLLSLPSMWQRDARGNYTYASMQASWKAWQALAAYRASQQQPSIQDPAAGAFYPQAAGWRNDPFNQRVPGGASAITPETSESADARDAERYRWLRTRPLWPSDNHEFNVGLCVDLWGEDGCGKQVSGEELDSACDAALAAQHKEKA